MTDKPNYFYFGLDACRYDSFEEADAPNMKSLGKLKMFHSPAGWTPPSILHYLTNTAPFGSGNQPYKFLPKEKTMQWIPSIFKRNGYTTLFLTPNQTMRRYSHAFSKDWDEKIWYWSNFRFRVDQDVEQLIEFWNEIPGPKAFLFLTMETHAPYPYSLDLPEEHFTPQYHKREEQVWAIEAIDKAYGRLIDNIDNTDMLIFSDHGTLFLDEDGHDGHGQWEFHHKMFEVPFIRGRI